MSEYEKLATEVKRTAGIVQRAEQLLYTARADYARAETNLVRAAGGRRYDEFAGNAILSRACDPIALACLEREHAQSPDTPEEVDDTSEERDTKAMTDEDAKVAESITMTAGADRYDQILAEPSPVTEVEGDDTDSRSGWPKCRLCGGKDSGGAG